MNQWIKRFGQVMLSLLVGILVLSSGAGLIYAKSCKKLEAIKWTEEDIKINSSISSDHGIEMLYQGYFEQEISVGEETRTAKVYIPEGSDQGSYFVVLTVPDGMKTETFLQKSGWVDKADKEDFCLFVMEPKGGKGKWGTVEEEAEYVKAAYAALVAGKYYLPFPTFYLVGYGTGGTALQKYAMTNAITVAGAAFINASDIDSSYLEEMAETKYAKSDIAYSEVPAPVWIINDKATKNTKAVVDYWKNANECVKAGVPFALGSKLYIQKSNTNNDFTACGNVAKVAVLNKKVDVTNPSLANTLYDRFLSKTTRYGGNAGGNVLAARPNYKALGVEFKTMEVDGYLREYLVYVPAKCKLSKKAVPVVYSMHGSNQTYKMMFDISRWFEVAREEGFILVMPTSTLNPATSGKVATPSWNSNGDVNRVNDIAFIEKLVQTIDEDYNVDPERRYISGQSNGSMMTNYVGMVIPEYFAAIGSTSGPIMQSTIPADAKTSLLPAYLLMGEYDFWSWDLDNGNVKVTLDYWTGRNQVGTAETPTTVETNGRFTTYDWKNADGITLYRYTQTAGRGHSFIPKENRMLWDWFDQWSRDSEKGILCNGVPIE